MYRLLGKIMYCNEILNYIVLYFIYGSEIMIKFCKVIIIVKYLLFIKFFFIYMSIYEKNFFDNFFF